MFGDISSLAKLLGEPGEAAPKQAVPAASPATLFQPPAPAPAPAPTPAVAAAPAPPAAPSKAIWDVDEVPTLDDALFSKGDTRKRPQYDVLFKQRVGAEDVYLGMSGKTPSSVDCEAFVVKIVLPGAALADIDLDVTEERICVQSPEYKLSTYLPARVRHKEGKAQWDGAKATLSVTLPLVKDGSMF